jgi:hypothetical protein
MNRIDRKEYNMPIKPKATANRSDKVIKNLRFTYHNISEFRIAAYSPDDAGETPPSQVHLLLNIEGLPAPAVLRFKGPDTLGFMIEELAKYRAHVWPDAPPVDVTGAWPEEASDAKND